MRQRAAHHQITLSKPATETDAPRPLLLRRSPRHHHHRLPAFLAPPQALALQLAADTLSHTRPLTDDAPHAHCGLSLSAPGARFIFALLAGPDATRPHRTTPYRASTGSTPRHHHPARLRPCAAHLHDCAAVPASLPSSCSRDSCRSPPDSAPVTSIATLARAALTSLSRRSRVLNLRLRPELQRCAFAQSPLVAVLHALTPLGSHAA